MLVVAAVVLGVASSVGAQVEPAGPVPVVWAASCVSPGSVDLTVYGRGWAAGPVALEVSNQDGDLLGVGSATARGGSGGVGVFQSRIPLGATGGGEVRLAATQAGGRAQNLITVGSCSPTITAVAGAPCALPGRPVGVTVTVRGAATSAFDLLLHHADLYGPAEAIDRVQPARPDGDYAIVLSVPSTPDRVVPVTVEARRSGGGFTYATTEVGLPPACSQPGTPGPTAPPTVPSTTPPTTAAATTPTPPAPGPVVTLPTFSFPPGVGPGPGRPSLAVVPALGRPGEATTVTGRGFVPSSAVTLRWRPGIGQWTVRVGGDGSFRTQVLVLPKDVEGRRVLEVLEGGATPAPYLVVPGSDQPAFNGVFVRG